jgi:hypothetical protein
MRSALSVLPLSREPSDPHPLLLDLVEVDNLDLLVASRRAEPAIGRNRQIARALDEQLRESEAYRAGGGAAGTRTGRLTIPRLPPAHLSARWAWPPERRRLTWSAVKMGLRGCGTRFAAVLVAAVGLSVCTISACGEPTDPSDEAITPDTHFATLCAKPGTHYRRAPAYQGPGPHPIEIFEAEPNDYSDPVYGDVFEFGGDGVWDAPPMKTQLIACWKRTSETPTQTVCQYDYGRTRPLYQATYSVTVYEARTGRQVGPPARVSGSTVRCPGDAMVDHGREHVVYNLPDSRDYTDALSAYVNGRAVVPTATP